MESTSGYENGMFHSSVKGGGSFGIVLVFSQPIMGLIIPFRKFVNEVQKLGHRHAGLKTKNDP